MHDVLISSIILFLIISIALTLVHFFTWRGLRLGFLLYWTLAWGVYALRFVFDLWGTVGRATPELSSLVDVCTAFSGTLLLLGFLAFTNTSLKRKTWLWALPIGTSLWSFTCNLYLANSQLAAIPTFIFVGLAQVYMGQRLWKDKLLAQYPSSRLLGTSLILWGLHKIEYPLLRGVAWFAPVGYWMGIGFNAITAISMLTLTLERVHAEKETTRSRFELLFDNTHDIILVLALNGRIIDANQTALRTYGYTLAELTKLSIYDLHTPGSNEFVESQIGLADLQGTLFEAAQHRKDGSTMVVEVSSVGTTVGDQRVLVSIIRDITERKRAEELVRKSQEFYLSLFEDFPALIWRTDTNGSCNYVNRSWSSFTGISFEEAKGEGWLRAIHPQDRNHSFKLFREALKERQTFRIHYRLQRQDGVYRWVTVLGRPFKDLDGEYAGYVGSIQDITDLRLSEERYRATFENTGTAMIIIEEDTTISLANKEMENLTGFSISEIQFAKSWTDFVHPKDRQRMIAYHWARRGAGGKSAPKVYEFTLIAKGNVEKEILCTVESIPGSKQSVASWLDISERKRAEEEIRYLSFHDRVTGLYNRAFFEEELDRLDTLRQMPLSIIMGDANGLKLVNDAFGHKAGDELLIRIARCMEESCRVEDITARWGGDEFIVLLPHTDEETAENIAERIKKSCTQTSDSGVRLSISLGVATKKDPEQEIHQVLQMAEERMYRQKLMETRSFRNSLITSLEESLRERDYETEEHAERLHDYAMEMGKVLGLPENQLNDLALLAALHDIGKLGIPDSILMKPGPLTPEEWKVMKRHSEIGYRIAGAVPDLAPVAEAILAHHERYDGTGYPRGLQAEEIPLISRILAIIDSYDVMTHERPYKEAYAPEEAQAELKRCSGTQFDPELVDVFLGILQCWQANQEAAVTMGIKPL